MGYWGIVINDKVKIGKDATIYHQVTIGEEKGKVPVIDDNVFIGASAIIIGGVKIGNNVKIGAGCVVYQDIPNDTTVVVAEPRIIIHKLENCL